MSFFYVPDTEISAVSMQSWFLWGSFFKTISIKSHPTYLCSRGMLSITAPSPAKPLDGLRMLLNMPFMRMLPVWGRTQDEIGHPDANKTTLNHWWIPQNTIALVHIIFSFCPFYLSRRHLWISKSTLVKVGLKCSTLKSPLFSPLRYKFFWISISSPIYVT